jgi:hypothetical protein
MLQTTELASKAFEEELCCVGRGSDGTQIFEALFVVNYFGAAQGMAT